MHGRATTPVQPARVALAPAGMHAAQDEVTSWGALAIVEAHLIHPMILWHCGQHFADLPRQDIHQHYVPRWQGNTRYALLEP